MESAHVVLFTAEAIDEAAALAEHCMVTEAVSYTHLDVYKRQL